MKPGDSAAWRARALGASLEEDEALHWSEGSRLHTVHWRQGLESMHHWLGGLDALRDRADELLEAGPESLATLAENEIKWGYDPGITAASTAPFAPQRRLEPGDLRDGIAASAQPGVKPHRHRNKSGMAERPDASQSPETKAPFELKQSPQAFLGGASSASRSVPRPARAPAPQGAESFPARAEAQAWWSQQLGSAATGPRIDPVIQRPLAGAQADDAPAGIASHPHPSQHDMLFTNEEHMPSRRDPLMPQADSRKPARYPDGDGSFSQPGVTKAAAPKKDTQHQRPGPAQPVFASKEAGKDPIWPPSLYEPPYSTPGASPGEPHGEGIGHARNRPSAKEAATLPGKKGGSLGRIPVDGKPEGNDAGAQAQAQAQAQQDGVRWLEDEESLAEQLHRLLRKQARRRGIDLS